MNQRMDKFESHYRQQLSALMDGELAPDQARFLLRRLSHDDELAGCWERWQLCGDVLRGNACAPAPQGFGSRVTRALAADAAAPVAAAGDGGALRQPWLRWGGGAALAASVAAVAFMIGRGQVPAVSPQAPAAVAASEALSVPDSETPARPAPVPARSPETVAASVPALPGTEVEPRPAASVAQQRPAGVVARTVATRAPSPARRDPATAVVAAPVTVPQPIAATSVSVPGVNDPSPLLLPLPATVADAAAPGANPFGVEPPQARPWPRSVLPQYSAAGAFNASVQVDAGARAFYPFEPRSSVLALPAHASPEPSPYPPQDSPSEPE